MSFENGMSANAIQWMKGEGLRSWKKMLKSGATITTESWDESLKGVGNFQFTVYILQRPQS